MGFAIGCSVMGFAVVLSLGRLLAPRYFCVEEQRAPPAEGKALLDGAADIFERGGKTAPVVDEDTVRVLHAKIGELAVANDFLSRRLKPWIGK